MFVNKRFTCLTCAYLKTTYYFHIKTRIFADFQICNSVPLMNYIPNFIAITIPEETRIRLIVSNLGDENKVFCCFVGQK